MVQANGHSRAAVESTYSLFDLICIGVGTTVGSGVFVLTGCVARDYAGPGVVISWLIAGAACCLSASSFAELSSRYPSSTSSYTFVKQTMGEWLAYLIAWCLSLECGISAAAISRTWGNKVSSLLHHNNIENSSGTSDEGGFNIYACSLQFLVVFLFLTGRDVSKWVVNIFTVAKVLLVFFMIVAGLVLFQPKNVRSFAPMGFSGILRGATNCFFGFVGYDEVCCLALETNNARQLMPQAVFGTIAIVCVLYGLSSLALVGMQDYQLISEESGYTSAFAYRHVPFAAAITAIGELTVLPLVVILSFLPQPRIMAALAEDHLAPLFLSKKDTTGNLTYGILFSGILTVLIAAFVPFVSLLDVISAGVLLSFNCTNTALVLVRCGHNATSVACLAIFHVLSVVLAFLVPPFTSSADVNNVSNSHWGLLYGTIAAMFLVLIAFSILSPDQDVTSYFCSATPNLDNVPRAARTTYMTPFVPFVPMLGTAINYILIGQLTWKALGYTALYFGVASLCYLLQVTWRSCNATTRTWPNAGYTQVNEESVGSEHLSLEIVSGDCK